MKPKVMAHNNIQVFSKDGKFFVLVNTPETVVLVTSLLPYSFFPGRFVMEGNRPVIFPEAEIDTVEKIKEIDQSAEIVASGIREVAQYLTGKRMKWKKIPETGKEYGVFQSGKMTGMVVFPGMAMPKTKNEAVSELSFISGQQYFIFDMYFPVYGIAGKENGIFYRAYFSPEWLGWKIETPNMLLGATLGILTGEPFNMPLSEALNVLEVKGSGFAALLETWKKSNGK